MADRPLVLVTGATGAIGTALVRELRVEPRTVDVRAAVRRPEAAQALRQSGVATTHLDLDGIERLPLTANEPLLDALSGVKRVFLLTGYSVDMLAQSKAVIDAAVRARVEHIVHLGAFASDDTTIVHLGWHQLVERYIESSGIGFTHLRPNTFMQNILNFSLRDDGTIQQFIGDAVVSWIDTDDIARAAAAVLRNPGDHRGSSYVLAAEALSVGAVAEILTDVVGRPFRYEPRSADDFLAGALAGGMEPLYARCVHNVFVRTREGTLPEVARVTNDFERITGQAPTLWRDYAEKNRARFLERLSSSSFGSSSSSR